MPELKYVEPDEIVDRPLPWQCLNLQMTASGCGSKLPTRNMARVGNRWYRIYCRIYSNSGTCYIVRKGEQLIIQQGERQ